MSRWAAALLLLTTTSCGGDGSQSARAAIGPASRGAAPPPTDLVYERGPEDHQDLYVIPAHGGAERRLTDDPAGDSLPRWAHDGSAVLFTSNRSGHWQIWEIPAEGGAAHPVRVNTATEWQVDESADGGRLAFLSNQEGPEFLWVMERATSEARVVVRHGKRSILGNPDWSPDGRLIAFSSNWRIGHQIYVLDLGSGEQRRLTGVAIGGCEPRFSPDGRRVVYVKRGHLSDKSRLAEIDLASGQERILVDWPALNYDPVYSPDGGELAFASNVTGEYVIYRERLADHRSWRMSLGTGPARNPDYARRPK